MKYVFYIILALLVLFILFLVTISVRYVNRVLYPKTRSYQEAKDKVIQQGFFPEEYIESLPYEELLIKSPYDYVIHGRLYPNHSKKYIIIVHGITMNIYGALKYLPFFYKKGFNVVVFDQRNHGLTGGPNTTYGYFEKWDLHNITDYLFNTYGNDISVGLHGESMGGAISVLNMGIDSRIDFGIIDSAFSDLPELLFMMLVDELHIHNKKLLSFINLFIKQQSGFSIEDVSPIKEIPGIEKPILFIHGEKDNYIPVKMAKIMYAFKLHNKYIYLSKDGEHGTSMASDPHQYDVELTKFLNIVYPESHFVESH
ncbi:MAG: alpha/beta hydrolase [Clostridiaceae bacterium]